MRSIIAFLLVSAIYLTSVLPFQLIVSAQIVPVSGDQQVVPDGLTFRLSNADPARNDTTRPTPPPAEPISDTDAGRILSRMPGIKSDPDDATDFAKRLGSQPPPKTGNRVPVKFPSDAETQPPPRVDQSAKELTVIRYSPEGPVGLAPDLTITFSQPMVAITSQDQAAETVPVQLTPNVAGQWRWLGTQTLMFDTDVRFPMATNFTARVPAGTKSANGQVLEKDVVWYFTTPPPSPVRMYPSGQITRRDQAIFIEFDQAINPVAAIEKVSLSANGRTLKTRLLYHDEAVREPTIGSWAASSDKTRTLAFRAVNEDGSTANALPADATITYSIEKGFPSAEGPLTTTDVKKYTFKTYGPMKYVRAYCNWQGSTTCTPFDPFYLEFSNQIDTAKFAEDLISVTPAIEGMKVAPMGNRIQISGVKRENTTYTIRAKSGLMDAYGQQTTTETVATIKTGRSPSNLYSQGGHMSVLDPYGPRSYSIYTVNHATVNVKLYAVTADDFPTYLASLRTLDVDRGTKTDIPGRLVFNEAVKVASKNGEMVETAIDLSRALNAGLGHVIVYIEPTVRRDQYDRSRVVTWLQSTQIGVDAFIDNTDLVAFATELKTGKPIAGANVNLGLGRAVSENEQVDLPENAGVISQIRNWIASIDPFGWWSNDATAEGENGAIIPVETVAQTYSNSTSANGVARLRLPDSGASNKQNVLVVKRGNDSAILPENPDYYWQDYGSWYRRSVDVQVKWYVFDDRRMYKPGEEVAVKGMLRRYVYGPTGDIEPIGGMVGNVTYTAKDQRGNDIATGTVAVSSFGAFDLKFKLKDNVDLGNGRIEFTTDKSGSGYTHSFQIQEFRRPEFEVSAKVETPAPHFIKGDVTVGVEAKYYAGGPLPDADTRWTVSATATNYTPPGRDEFVFGIWTPWWENPYARGGRWGSFDQRTQNFSGKTNEDGKHRIKVDLDSANPPRPYAMTANAAVQDVNRQSWASNAAFLVHPSSLYVGIKSKRYFVQKGGQIEIDTIVTDLDGKAVTGRAAKVKGILRDHVFEKGSWTERIVDEAVCNVTSSDKPETCRFTAKNGGRYTIEAEVSDDQNRPNISRMTVWVPGGKTMPSRTVEEEKVEIIPSQKDFKPGDIAELLVISPIAKAEGIMTIRREGIIKTERFTMTDNAITLKVPVDAAYLPNVNVSIDLVGSSPRVGDDGQPPTDKNIPPRPAFANGSIDLKISSESRRLTVSAVAAEKELTPGSSTKVNVQVTDADGKPAANSEVAIVVVDEAILALSNYSIADPLGTFYTERPDGVRVHKSRSKVLLNDPSKLRSEGLVSSTAASIASGIILNGRQAGSLPPPPPAAKSKLMMESVSADMSSVAAPEEGKPIELRSDFSALANFSPSVRTDSRGRATIDLKMPDNLTRYRVTAVATDGAKRFGKSESDITARLPLMIRPSAPRFMNFGDRAELPVVVQNQTGSSITVDVAVRSTNAELVGGTSEKDRDGTTIYRHGKRVTVPANDRVEVLFSSATVKAGTARFQFAASSGNFNDAAEISLPVWTPATTEAFATYGSIEKDDTIFQPIALPNNIFTQFGGLEVSTSTTQLQELTDAYIYLAKYPYACSEQISSRMIATAALRDVLSAFKSKDMPTKEELDRQFASDIKVLASRQRDDGSFGLWRRERDRYEYPYLTIHVAHALGLAKQKGYNVPDQMIAKTRPYLANIERYFDEWHKQSPEAQWTVTAYALYVRDLLGDRDAAKAKKLLADATLEKLPFESIGWILSVIANDAASVEESNKIVRYLLNRTTETAATANFVTNYRDSGWLVMASNRRADGVILNALVKMAGGSASSGERAELTAARDLIPKVVRGLLAHRKKGAWANTQENVFILLAMDRYFNAFEGVTPDLVAKIWIGDTYAGEQIFKGRTTDTNELFIPMSYVASQGGTPPLVLDRRGAGRLYYRIGLKYAPSNLRLEAADRGFSVSRRYEAVDDPLDVKENPDGTWTVRSGARVRVKISMVAPSRRYHVALVDHLPAGFEILNPSLANSESIPGDRSPSVLPVTNRGRSVWIGRYWFEHQNLRDERAEAFASLVWGGNYEYSFVARATTPGSFIAPPAKAEEMYHPETFGRSKTDLVRVE